MSTVFRLLLLAGLLVCAVATALVKKPLRAVIIYMAYSIIMSVIWILLEAPDLAPFSYTPLIRSIKQEL